MPSGNGTVFLDQYTFLVNDSGADEDFNDLYVTIGAFKSVGWSTKTGLSSPHSPSVATTTALIVWTRF